MVTDIGEDRLCEVIDLFKDCFKKNGYYENVFGDDFDKFVRDEMTDIIRYFLRQKCIYGYVINNKLVGFLMHFEYREMRKNIKMFTSIFGNRGDKQIPYKKELHNKILALDGDIEYLLCLGVDEKYRGQNIAGKMLDYLLEQNSTSNITADITNISTLPLYECRNFKESNIDDGYVYVYKTA